MTLPRTILAAASIIAIVAISLSGGAQRRVTPVNNAATATQPVNENAQRDSLDRTHVIEMADAQGNIVLVDTITGKEFVDSTAQKKELGPKMKYPLLHSASISVDLFTPALRALGTDYGLFECAAELNLHNRYIPVVEFGLGSADYAPEDNNYTYRTPVAPFFRLGMNYNFFFKSNPDYLLMAGFRYGFSPFKMEVNDITQQNDYWGQDLNYSIPSQSITAGYFELLLALRVRIIDNFSLGWAVKYHSILHETVTQHGEAWYIPGYGSRTSSIAASFSVTYTIPLHKSDAQEVIDALPPVEPATAADAPDTDGALDTPDTLETPDSLAAPAESDGENNDTPAIAQPTE